MDELLSKTIEMRKIMSQEMDAFTKVSLVMEVQKFQIETLENLLKQNDIEMPSEIQQLINDLEQIKNLEDDEGQPLNESLEADMQELTYIDENENNHMNGSKEDNNLVHKQKILNAILKRINKQKHQVNQGNDVQSDFESATDDDEEDDRIEKIVS